ncbi:MAG: hypothetical protein IJ019_00215 [Alphaproteobacteria bacterium]|nr:hypothetical protein [Alphaproteobacteria bacterium]
MKNTVCAFMTLLLLTACSNSNNEHRYIIKIGENETAYLKDVNVCPKVHVRREDSTLVQKQGKNPVFKIEAVSYSGFCYFDMISKREKAVIKPQFKIVRLSERNITDLQFSYYLETAEGPKAYLGRKTYFADVSVPLGVKEINYIADATELTIPESGTYDLDVYLGLNADISELQFKK